MMRNMTLCRAYRHHTKSNWPDRRGKIRPPSHFLLHVLLSTDIFSVSAGGVGLRCGSFRLAESSRTSSRSIISRTPQPRVPPDLQLAPAKSLLVSAEMTRSIGTATLQRAMAAHDLHDTRSCHVRISSSAFPGKNLLANRFQPFSRRQRTA